MSFPIYEELAASGVEWIGDVPNHWLKSRVKFDALLKARVGWHGLKSDEFTEIGPYLVTGSDFKGREVSWNDCYHCTSERYEQDKNIQLQKGDLLITKDGTIGKLMLIKSLPGKATLNSGIFVVRPLNESLSTDFYYWLLQSSVFYQFINAYQSGTTINHLYQETFGNLPYAKPLKSEQTQIARFLDHETAKIDALIAEQKRLIKLLQEKRQAVISHAVTKGLDPNVPMKDSGVEWLGEVPAHWDFRKISHGFENVGSGTTPPSNASEWYDNGDIPWVTTGELRESTILNTRKKVTNRALEEFSSLKVHPKGSLVVAMYGATIGRLGILGVNATVNQACVVLSGAITINISFAYYWLLANKETIISLFASGGGQPNINQDTITSLRIPAPSTIEQSQITDHLDKVLGVYDELRHESQKVIATLLERRSAIISAAVTGKIDVRDWQPPLDESAFDELVQKAGLEASA